MINAPTPTNSPRMSGGRRSMRGMVLYVKRAMRRRPRQEYMATTLAYLSLRRSGVADALSGRWPGRTATFSWTRPVRGAPSIAINPFGGAAEAESEGLVYSRYASRVREIAALKKKKPAAPSR